MSMMAFDFLPLPLERSSRKPRTTGRTMVIDMGIGPETVRDSLRTASPYVDLVKIAVGSARLYSEQILREKAAIYEEFSVDMYIGGQFVEYVVTKHGFESVPRFMKEVYRLGIHTIEVSDNCIELTDEERCRLVKIGVDAGLEVHGEVGSKDSKADINELIRQSEVLLQAGCSMVLFEAAELIEASNINVAAIETIKSAVAPESTMIELPGPWIKGVSLSDVYEMMKLVLRTFGPDANIGNVTWDQIFELECARCGFGTAGPTFLN